MKAMIDNDTDLGYAKIMGDRLHFIRNYNKISQTVLAKEIGCTQQYIAKWESGKAFVPTKWLIRICKYFQMDLSFFNPLNQGLEPNIKEGLEKYQLVEKK